MRFILAAAAAALLVGGVARADEIMVQPNQPIDNRPTLGVGMICNTADEAERFLKLRARGSNADRAMLAVNKHARDPRACGIAAVAYVRDRTVVMRTVRNKLLQVVRINVVAGYNRNGWHQIANMVQYAVIEPKGYGV